MRLPKRITTDECGAGLVEWIVVTLILTVAIYAILQVIGPDVQRFIDFVAVKFL